MVRAVIEANRATGPGPWGLTLLRTFRPGDSQGHSVDHAENPKITDAEFDRLPTHAQNALPDKLARCSTRQPLADAMTANMGAAVLNGAPVWPGCWGGRQ